MSCGSCGKRQPPRNSDDVMGGYKYLTDRQIKARLENYKRKYCKDCEKRYICDFSMYQECKKNK